MKFYPKALLATAAAGFVLWLAIDVRVGIAAVIASIVLYAFEFLSWTGFFRPGSSA